MLTAASTAWGDANGCLYTCPRVRVRPSPPVPRVIRFQGPSGHQTGQGGSVAWLGRRGTELCVDDGELFAVRVARSFV